MSQPKIAYAALLAFERTCAWEALRDSAVELRKKIVLPDPICGKCPRMNNGSKFVEMCAKVPQICTMPIDFKAESPGGFACALKCQFGITPNSVSTSKSGVNKYLCKCTRPYQEELTGATFNREYDSDRLEFCDIGGDKPDEYHWYVRKALETKNYHGVVKSVLTSSFIRQIIRKSTSHMIEVVSLESSNPLSTEVYTYIRPCREDCDVPTGPIIDSYLVALTKRMMKIKQIYIYNRDEARYDDSNLPVCGKPPKTNSFIKGSWKKFKGSKNGSNQKNIVDSNSHTFPLPQQAIDPTQYIDISGMSVVQATPFYNVKITRKDGFYYHVIEPTQKSDGYCAVLSLWWVGFINPTIATILIERPELMNDKILEEMEYQSGLAKEPTKTQIELRLLQFSSMPVPLVIRNCQFVDRIASYGVIERYILIGRVRGVLDSLHAVGVIVSKKNLFHGNNYFLTMPTFTGRHYGALKAPTGNTLADQNAQAAYQAQILSQMIIQPQPGRLLKTVGAVNSGNQQQPPAQQNQNQQAPQNPPPPPPPQVGQLPPQQQPSAPGISAGTNQPSTQQVPQNPSSQPLQASHPLPQAQSNAPTVPIAYSHAPLNMLFLTSLPNNAWSSLARLYDPHSSNPGPARNPSQNANRTLFYPDGSIYYGDPKDYNQMLREQAVKIAGQYGYSAFTCFLNPTTQMSGQNSTPQNTTPPTMHATQNTTGVTTASGVPGAANTVTPPNTHGTSTVKPLTTTSLPSQTSANTQANGPTNTAPLNATNNTNVPNVSQNPVVSSQVLQGTPATTSTSNSANSQTNPQATGGIAGNPYAVPSYYTQTNVTPGQPTANNAASQLSKNMTISAASAVTSQYTYVPQGGTNNTNAQPIPAPVSQLPNVVPPQSLPTAASNVTLSMARGLHTLTHMPPLTTSNAMTNNANHNAIPNQGARRCQVHYRCKADQISGLAIGPQFQQLLSQHTCINPGSINYCHPGLRMTTNYMAEIALDRASETHNMIDLGAKHHQIANMCQRRGIQMQIDGYRPIAPHFDLEYYRNKYITNIAVIDQYYIRKHKIPANRDSVLNYVVDFGHIISVDSVYYEGVLEFIAAYIDKFHDKRAYIVYNSYAPVSGRGEYYDGEGFYDLQKSSLNHWEVRSTPKGNESSYAHRAILRDSTTHASYYITDNVAAMDMLVIPTGPTSSVRYAEVSYSPAHGLSRSFFEMPVSTQMISTEISHATIYGDRKMIEWLETNGHCFRDDYNTTYAAYINYAKRENIYVSSNCSMMFANSHRIYKRKQALHDFFFDLPRPVMFNERERRLLKDAANSFARQIEYPREVPDEPEGIKRYANKIQNALKIGLTGLQCAIAAGTSLCYSLFRVYRYRHQGFISAPNLILYGIAIGFAGVGLFGNWWIKKMYPNHNYLLALTGNGARIRDHAMWHWTQYNLRDVPAPSRALRDATEACRAICHDIDVPVRGLREQKLKTTTVITPYPSSNFNGMYRCMWYDLPRRTKRLISVNQSNLSYTVYSKDMDNTMAVLKRQFSCKLLPDPQLLPGFKRFVDSQISEYIGENLEMRLPDYLDTIAPHKRKVYEQGYNDYLSYSKISRKYEIMVKTNETEMLPERKNRPRCIFNPSPQTKMVLGCINQHLIHSLKTSSRGREFICGLNNENLATKFQEAISDLAKNGKVLAIPLDGSSHDAHQHASLIEIVDNTYIDQTYNSIALKAGINPSMDRQILMALKSTRADFVAGPRKMPYISGFISGTTFSGHPTRTTFGNSLRVIMYIRYAMHNGSIPDTHYRLFVSGDDVLLFINECFCARARDMLFSVYSLSENITHGLGLLAKEINIVDLHHLDFLSRDIFITDSGCHINRALTKQLLGSTMQNRSISTLTTGEYRKLVTECNILGKTVPLDGRLHDLFQYRVQVDKAEGANISEEKLNRYKVEEKVQYWSPVSDILGMDAYYVSRYPDYVAMINEAISLYGGQLPSLLSDHMLVRGLGNKETNSIRLPENLISNTNELFQNSMEVIEKKTKRLQRPRNRPKKKGRRGARTVERTKKTVTLLQPRATEKQIIKKLVNAEHFPGHNPQRSHLLAVNYVRNMEDCSRPFSHLYPAGMSCARFHQTQAFAVTPAGTDVCLIVNPSALDSATDFCRLYNASDTNNATGASGTSQPTYPISGPLSSKGYRVVGAVVRIASTGTLTGMSGMLAAGLYSHKSSGGATIMALTQFYGQSKFSVQPINQSSITKVVWTPPPGGEAQGFESSLIGQQGTREIYIALTGLTATTSVMNVYVDVVAEWLPETTPYLYGVAQWPSDIMAYQMACTIMNKPSYNCVQLGNAADLHREVHVYGDQSGFKATLQKFDQLTVSNAHNGVNEANADDSYEDEVIAGIVNGDDLRTAKLRADHDHVGHKHGKSKLAS